MRRPRQALSDLPLRVKGLVVVATPVAALLVAVVGLVLVERAERSADAVVTQSIEVRTALQSALSLLVDAETGTRGYLLTGRKQWLVPYDNARQKLPSILAHLEKLTADNPSRHREVRNVTALVETQLEKLTEVPGVGSGGVRDSASLEAALTSSKTSMELARQVFGKLQADEQRVLDHRRAHASQVRRQLYVLIGVVALFGPMGGLLAALVFTESIVRRIERLRENAQRLAERRPLLNPPPGKDEIAQLENVLQETNALLDNRERELRETHKFLEHLVETSPAVIFQQDPSTFTVTYVSPNVERELGYSAREVVSVPDFWVNRIHPEDLKDVKASYELAIAVRAPHIETEYRFRRKDGRYRWFYSFLQIEYDSNGEAVEFLGHDLDITPRKMAEEALLEREASLDAAYKELEAFSYSVSHDLRAPLRRIEGFCTALFEDYGDKLDTTARGYFERMRAAAQRMGFLIDDLLQLSRVTRSPLRRESVDLSLLANHTAQELRLSQPDREVEFVIAPGLADECDPGLVRVVLENLLGNAWKFTSGHERARIEFGCKDHTYFVRDDGAGFDPEYADRLFVAFQRLHAAHEFGGSGIGLATVQRIIRRHGGRVWAEGAVEKGAIFYFTLRSSRMDDIMA